LIRLVSIKTPDTSTIPNMTIALMKEHQVPAECVGFDRGGGGKQHADALRAMGYPVRTIAFGEAVMPEPRRYQAAFGERVAERETRYTYLNMRAAMYGELSQLLDPAANPQGFGLPVEYSELRRQLAPIPRLYDKEGRLKMLPKNRTSAGSNEKTLTEILGCSPDQADSLVLAIHVMLHKTTRAQAGAIR
jgi:hypothetical protein